MISHVNGGASSKVLDLHYDTAVKVLAAAVLFLAFEYFADYVIRPPLARFLAPRLKRSEADVDKALKGFCHGGQASSMFHVLIQLPVIPFALSDKVMRADTFYGQSDLAKHLAVISTGYFVYDLFICIFRFETQGWSFLLHAVCSLLVFAYGTFTSTVLYYAGAFLLWEASTPFVIARHFLAKLKCEDSPAYTAVAGLMFITFFLSRNVWGVYASYVFVVASQQELRNPRPGGFAPVMIHLFRVANVVLNGLNVMWFTKMLRKIIGLVKGSKRADTAEKANGKAE